MAGRRAGSAGDGHEYRVTLAIFGIGGYINGIIDALTDDFTVKFFLSQITMVILFTVAIYEMAVMDAPRRPVLASVLLSVFGVMGYTGFWHSAWLLAWRLARGGYPHNLWLAPNVYMDLYLYSTITGVLLLAYFLFVVLVNVSTRVKMIYMPKRRYYRGGRGA